MVKLVIAVVLLAHGIGHLLGVLQVLKIAVANPRWSGDSWLLTSTTGTPIANAIGIALWTVAIAGFAATAAVVVGWLPATWWQPLALGSAVVSLVALALFPTAFPTMSTIGALAVDLAVLAAIFWPHWAPSELGA